MLKNCLLSLLLASSVIIFNVYFLKGSSITDRFALIGEIAGFEVVDTPYLTNELIDEWVDTWIWGQTAPSHYRILGKLLVLPTYVLGKSYFSHYSIAFYNAFLCWSFISLFLTFFFFYQFVRQLFHEFEPNEQFAQISSIFLALCPPILCAFKFPVHGSPNDFLGYALILIALISLQYKNIFYFSIIMFISIFCRETNFIIVFLFLFFYTAINFKKRLLITALLAMALLTYRLIWYSHYNPLEGAQLNIKYLYESLIFFLLVFTIFWITGVLGYLRLRKQPYLNDVLSALVKAFPYLVVITTTIVLALARMREIRIEFILFFMILPFSIFYLYEIKDNILYLKNKYYLLYLLLLSVVIFKLRVSLMPLRLEEHDNYLLIFNNWYGGLGGGWVNISLIYLFFFLVFFPLCFLPKKTANKTHDINSPASTKATR
ncbi:hypothetical protein BegalDRAFT_0511 [Beggiatoa alba B18LD]|uniref:Uncharacterized protein n=1 Tax=Beggiatoa alba B18LD TaxID=395493 RepID=I3CCT6_9GAMM|nr:hypothetical protein [Beggiatoa alba]EIJ41429.1 hypothetical protein BegalDRAFT_0511 [Beggiatoa alba B18LD]